MKNELHYQQGPTKWIFNLDGKLVRIESGSSKTFIDYDQNQRINGLTIGNSKIQFQLSSNDQVIQVTGLQSLSYTYSEAGLLEAVKGNRKKTVYVYDENKNLIKIKSERQIETITYSSPQDEVRTYEISNGCKAFYQFRKVTDIEMKSLVTARCPSSEPLTKSFTFIAKRNLNGSISLVKVLTAGSNDVSANLP